MLPDLRQEPHVEHPVGFVEHQELEVGELRVRRPQMIEQPSRRGDQDVDAAAERVLLRPHADAAENRRAGDRRVDGKVVEVVEDLRRELPRRREHERARRAARLLDQLVQDRQQERRRLAAARLGAREDVAAFEPRRNGVSLDWRRPCESEFLDAFEQAGVEFEIVE